MREETFSVAAATVSNERRRWRARRTITRAASRFTGRSGVKACSTSEGSSIARFNKCNPGRLWSCRGASDEFPSILLLLLSSSSSLLLYIISLLVLLWWYTHLSLVVEQRVKPQRNVDSVLYIIHTHTHTNARAYTHTHLVQYTTDACKYYTMCHDTIQ